MTRDERVRCQSQDCSNSQYESRNSTDKSPNNKSRIQPERGSRRRRRSPEASWQTIKSRARMKMYAARHQAIRVEDWRQASGSRWRVSRPPFGFRLNARSLCVAAFHSSIPPFRLLRCSKPSAVKIAAAVVLRTPDRQTTTISMQFGVWSTLAIHDTSSVVGAAMQDGAREPEIATTIKLTRALWIVPVKLAIGMLWNRGSDEKGAGNAKRPCIILGLLAAAAILIWISGLKPSAPGVFVGAQLSLVFKLFSIGFGLSRQALQVIGRSR
jgi:Conserved hypothetical protein 698